MLIFLLAISNIGFAYLAFKYYAERNALALRIQALNRMMMIGAALGIGERVLNNFFGEKKNATRSNNRDNN